MRRWVWIVTGLYALALLAVTWPVVAIALVGQTDVAQAASIFIEPAYWIGLVVLVICQFALLSTPVQATGRPLTKKPVIVPLIVTGLMIALLVGGAVLSLAELLVADKAGDYLPFALLLGVLTWVGWGVLFFRWSAGRSAENMLFRQSKVLFAGSVLELLVAIPTHVVARSRDYCCAGMMTFFGLTMGIAVMLFSFGPAVYFLYLDRWRKLHPNRD